MLHEFAVDPTCVPSLDALRRILDQCVLHLGRYVSDFPRRRWECEVRRHLQPQISQSWQAGNRLADTLIALRRRGGLIDTGRTYDSESPRTWLDNALREHGIRGFHAIVARAKSERRDFVLAADELDPDTPRWNVETEAKIPRTAEALVECIAPLIRLSRQILLVDPHFTPDTARYQVALEHFLAAAHAGGRRYCRLEYHTKVRVRDGSSESARRDWITRFGKDCQQWIPSHVPKDVPLSDDLQVRQGD